MFTFSQALRLYPASFFWAIAISFTIIMEGYDTYLLGNFYAYPSFAKKYGQYHPDSDTWVIPANRQVALSDVGNIGNVVGLLRMGVLTDQFGHRLVIMAGLIVMVGLNFMTFFAPNVQVLTAAMALGVIPTGMFGIMGLAYASDVLDALVGTPTEWSFRIPFAIEWAVPVPISSLPSSLPIHRGGVFDVATSPAQSARSPDCLRAPHPQRSARPSR
jgi:SP family general alpha glucoside:H+ symporter-like MFS transporter